MIVRINLFAFSRQVNLVIEHVFRESIDDPLKREMKWKRGTSSCYVVFSLKPICFGSIVQGVALTVRVFSRGLQVYSGMFSEICSQAKQSL